MLSRPALPPPTQRYISDARAKHGQNVSSISTEDQGEGESATTCLGSVTKSCADATKSCAVSLDRCLSCAGLRTALADAVSPTELPGLYLPRDVNVKAVGNFFELDYGLASYNFKENINTIIGALSLHRLVGQPWAPSTFVTAQNSVIEHSLKLPQEEAARLGKEIIWGYGADFPTDRLVGELYSTTLFARLLEYDTGPQEYVLDTTGNAASQPDWARSLLKLLDPTKYMHLRLSFRACVVGSRLSLLPSSAEIIEDGTVTETIAAAAGSRWQQVLTAAVTASYFCFQNLHAAMHWMTATTASAMMMSLPVAFGWRCVGRCTNSLASGLVPLVQALSANVFFKVAEVRVLLWSGDNGVLSGTGEAATSVFCVTSSSGVQATAATIVAELAAATAGGTEAYMSGFVLPAGAPKEHASLFVPGVQEEIAASFAFGAAVDKAAASSNEREAIEMQLASAYQRLADGGVYDALATSFGATLACACVAGGAFHSQSLLTKIGYTPLVSSRGTRVLPTEFDAAQTFAMGIVYGTTNEFDERLQARTARTLALSMPRVPFPSPPASHRSRQFADIAHVNSRSIFAEAAKAFSVEANAIRTKMLADYVEEPSTTGVQPTYYYPKVDAVKLNFINTMTTYI